ncbi:MAG TPA: hypothetical protein VFS14_04455 [Candidatus Saccharimonadales bacterium]|nr:hypothetical protein [Candidatus Saccharimonadales bacterium]
MTIAVDPTKAESPYDYLDEDYARVLHRLLDLVPEAKEKFDEGKVPAAIADLRAAKHVRLNPSAGMTKGEFLSRVSFAMPNKYSI